MANRPGPPNTTGSGPVRLRQIALVAKDLQKAKDLITKVLGVGVLYVDPEVGQWGLENFLVALGGEVLEVVSPTKEGTAAGRILDKKGDGGYMVIMQHPDAQKRREYIEEKGLAKVIWSHKGKNSVAVQYHPRSVKGGVIPELDSQDVTEDNPKPLDRFTPWHACGPDEKSYIEGMKRNAHLSLLGVVTRLPPGDWSSETTATQWEAIFGVPRSRDQIAFTNARIGFLHGEEGEHEGMVHIGIGVRGEKKRDEILQRAEEQGVLRNENGKGKYVRMLGLNWRFSVTHLEEPQSRL